MEEGRVMEEACTWIGRGEGMDCFDSFFQCIRMR